MTRSTTTRRPNHAPLDLAVIHAKCTDEGDCWIWDGALHCGHPVVRHGGKVISVRRYIAKHIHGRAVDGKLASTTCANSQCCAPAHIALVPRRQLNRSVTKLTRHQSQLSRNHKLAMKKRALSTLTVDQVQQIRESDLPGRALAAQYGVVLYTVQRIRNGASWRDYSSPFAQLIGRAK